MKITETLSVKITDIFIDNHVFPSRQRAAYIYCFDFCFDLFLYNLSLLILGIFFHHGWLALVYVFYNVSTQDACRRHAWHFRAAYVILFLISPSVSE